MTEIKEWMGDSPRLSSNMEILKDFLFYLKSKQNEAQSKEFIKEPKNLNENRKEKIKQ
jgi:hypothetical protein